MNKADFEQFRDRWDLVKQHEKATEISKQQAIMTKADKMFEELGYKKIVEDKYRTVYDYYGIGILFKNLSKEVLIDGMNVREHLAIHEKMKELGWIE